MSALARSTLVLLKQGSWLLLSCSAPENQVSPRKGPAQPWFICFLGVWLASPNTAVLEGGRQGPA